MPDIAPVIGHVRSHDAIVAAFPMFAHHMGGSGEVHLGERTTLLANDQPETGDWKSLPPATKFIRGQESRRAPGLVFLR